MTHLYKNLSNLNNLAKEICEREKSIGRELNIAEVKAIIRHLSDLIGEEWDSRFEMKITKALRQNGLKRLSQRK